MDENKKDEGNIIPIKVEQPIVSPLSEEFVKKASDISKNVAKNDIPDSLYKQILDITGSKSAIVITFDDKMIAPTTALQSFRVHSVNVLFDNIKGLLHFISLALSGALGTLTKYNDETK